jgi:hypothetical protein
LRAVQKSVSQNPPSNLIAAQSNLDSAVYGRKGNARRRNCLRPLNVVRSLTTICQSLAA